MKTLARALVVVLTICWAGSVLADTHYVAHNGQIPAPPYNVDFNGAASNIQEAVDRAVAGDVVLVDQGTYTAPPNPVTVMYTTNVVYIKTNMILRSISGNPADTIIDGQGVNRCVFMGPVNTQNGAYVLDGFTITNGFVTGSNTTRGAGVYIYKEAGNLLKTAIVQNCVIAGNYSFDRAVDGRGCAGGIYVGWVVDTDYIFSIIVSNCTIRNNFTNGMFTSSYCTNQNSRLLISHCVVSGNRGSGIFLGGGKFSNTVEYCTFTDNITEGSGGGLNTARRTDIYNCLFTRNGCYDGQPPLGGPATNRSGGGAVYVDQGTTTSMFFNCTIVSNWAGSQGIGGVMMHSNANPEWVYFYNTIIYSNRNPLAQSDSGGSAVKYWTNSYAPGLTGAGNISTPPPEFENVDGGDLRLKRYSRGVDAGLVQDWMTGGVDLAGRPRVSANGLVDMGAYETSLETNPGYYVARNGQTPAYPYTNAATAASNIQDAVNAYWTNYPTTIWVAPGRYTLPPNAVDYLGKNVVYINKPLTLRGSSSNPQDTVIDGEGVNRGICWDYSANEYAQPFVLDGLTISNCYATNTGGGIFFRPQLVWTAQVLNCYILTNTVAYGLITNTAIFGNYSATNGCRGGGIGMFHNSLLWGLTVSNTVIKYNQALYKDTNAVPVGAIVGGYGGGVFVRANGQKLFTKCLIAENYASDGGGCYMENAGMTMENSTFRGNVSDAKAAASGLSAYSANGAMSLGGTTVLRNSLLHNNVGYRFGAIYLGSQDSYFYNCTIVSNTGLAGAGGIGARFTPGNNTYLQAVNCIVTSNNVPPDNNIDMDGPTNKVPDGRVSLVMSNCCIRTNGMSTNNLAFFDLMNPAKGNITSAPAFLSYAGQNFRLAGSSPCRNKGQLVPGIDAQRDLDNLPRVEEGLPEMGAYEYQPGGTFMFLR